MNIRNALLRSDGRHRAANSYLPSKYNMQPTPTGAADTRLHDHRTASKHSRPRRAPSWPEVSIDMLVCCSCQQPLWAEDISGFYLGI
jgi:hypothetical protein